MKEKQVVMLCVKTRRGRMHRFKKRDVAAATGDAQFYLDNATDRGSEYWYGSEVWLEVAAISTFRRVDLDEATA